MKKTLIIAALLISSISAFAQTPEEDSWVNLKTGVVIEPVSVDFFNQYGFGFSQFSAENCSISSNMRKSFSFYMDMASIDLNLTRNGHLQLHSALRWTFDNIVPEENVIFGSESGVVTAVPVTSIITVDKSKMRIDYLGIPVGFAYKNSGFKVYANAIGELRTKSISKVKTDKGDDESVNYGGKQKNNLGGFENLRASVECGVGYKNIGVFFKHTLTPTFKSTTFSQSDVNFMTIGLTLTL